MKITTAAVLFLCLLGFGCSGDDPTGPGTHGPSNPTSYLLTKQTWEHTNGTNGQTFLYFYNENNLVSEIQRIQWGTFRADGGPLQKWIDTSYQSFEYRNNLLVGGEVHAGGEGFYKYEYTGGFLTRRTLYYPDGSIQEYTRYWYNDRGNLSRVDIYRDDRIAFQYTLEYNDIGNLTSIVRYQRWDTPNEYWRYTYADFDTGVNYMKAVNGLPITFEFDNNYHSFCSVCPNNYGLQVYYPNIQFGQPIGTPVEYTYSYKYNEEGLPVVMGYGGWTVSMEYRKYK